MFWHLILIVLVGLPMLSGVPVDALLSMQCVMSDDKSVEAVSSSMGESGGALEAFSFLST